MENDKYKKSVDDVFSEMSNTSKDKKGEEYKKTNSFSGQLPSASVSLSNLKSLAIKGNFFSGTLYTRLGKYRITQISIAK